MIVMTLIVVIASALLAVGVYFIYKASYWFGYKYIGPAIGKILNLKNKSN